MLSESGQRSPPWLSGAAAVLLAAGLAVVWGGAGGDALGRASSLIPPALGLLCSLACAVRARRCSEEAGRWRWSLLAAAVLFAAAAGALVERQSPLGAYGEVGGIRVTLLNSGWLPVAFYAFVLPRDRLETWGGRRVWLVRAGLAGVFLQGLFLLALPALEELAGRSVFTAGMAAGAAGVLCLGPALLLGTARPTSDAASDAPRGAPLRWLQTAVCAQALSAAVQVWLEAAPGSPWPLLTPAGHSFRLAAWAALAAAAARPETVLLAGSRRFRERMDRVLSLGTLLTAAAFATAAAMRPSLFEPALALALGVLLALYGALQLVYSALRNGRYREELALQRHRSAELKKMLDHIKDAVITQGPSGKVLFANGPFYRMFGLRPPRITRRVEELLHPDDRSHRRRLFQKVFEGVEKTPRREYRGLRAGGAIFHLEETMTRVDSLGEGPAVQSVIRDVSDRRVIERSQRALAQRLEFFISEMPLGCVIWDLDFSVQEWNEAAAKIFGWRHAEVMHRRYSEFLAVTDEDPEKIEELWKQLRSRKTSCRVQCFNQTQDRGRIECEWFHTSLVDESGAVVAVASMVQDLTERRELESQLLQSQKMDAVGTLAGGIAHDFNNLLTVILGHLTLAEMKVESAHQAYSNLQEAEKAAQRASQLTGQLLRVSRRRAAELKPVNVNRSVEEVVSLLRHGADRKIEIEVELQPELWPVEAADGQLEQVLMNLCVNARDAVGERGRIRVSTLNRAFHRDTFSAHPGARTGEFVEIAVADNGCGIDERVRPRIFEPFFTTKEVGKGAGLGLSIVYGIVQHHRGWIEVASKPGEGSVFRVYLPRTRREVPPETQKPKAAARAHSGDETILLVDDEDAVREFARQVLAGQGHEVLEARDGEEAVEVFRLHQHHIDLVLLDLTMPKKSGREVFRELKEINPDVPVIVSSGYSKEAATDGGGVQAFLPKPYTAQDLLASVSEAFGVETAADAGSEPETRRP